MIDCKPDTVMKTKLKKHVFSESDNQQRLRELKQVQQVLLKKNRGRQPDPLKMPAYKLNEEHTTLGKLVGTTFMTKRLFARWLEIDRAFSSAVACEMAYPY
jgi:hypothetical protein